MCVCVSVSVSCVGCLAISLHRPCQRRVTGKLRKTSSNSNPHDVSLELPRFKWRGKNTRHKRTLRTTMSHIRGDCGPRNTDTHKAPQHTHTHREHTPQRTHTYRQMPPPLNKDTQTLHACKTHTHTHTSPKKSRRPLTCVHKGETGFNAVRVSSGNDAHFTNIQIHSSPQMLHKM